MKEIGYIKLHRKILDNPIVCKDSDYFSVWVYLLLNATHKEISAVFKGEKIILMPGQLITGRISIANKLKISESKVKRILIDLENDQQIDRQRSNKNSLISILNWEYYQKNDQQNTQHLTGKRPTSDHKQECKEIYLYLFNKYKEQIEKEHANRKIQIISACQSCKEYGELSAEEQDKLFYALMSIEKKFK